jgi:heme A synthase
MNKLTSRDIQVFVAGAFAYCGFDSLLWSPDVLAHSHDLLAFTDFVGGVIGLVLAGAVIAGRMRALRWMQVFLWLDVIQYVATICVFILSKYGISVPLAHGSLYQAIHGIFTVSALLCLIAWSRSKRFRGDGTPNTALEPTPTAP